MEETQLLNVQKVIVDHREYLENIALFGIFDLFKGAKLQKPFSSKIR